MEFSNRRNLIISTKFSIDGSSATANLYSLDLGTIGSSEQEDIFLDPVEKIELPVDTENGCGLHRVGADDFDSNIYLFACGSNLRSEDLNSKCPSYYLSYAPGSKKKPSDWKLYGAWKVYGRHPIGIPSVIATNDFVYVLANDNLCRPRKPSLLPCKPKPEPFDWFPRKLRRGQNFFKPIRSDSFDYPGHVRSQHVTGFAVFDTYLLISTCDAFNIDNVRFLSFHTIEKKWTEVTRTHPRSGWYPPLRFKSPVYDCKILTYSGSADYLVVYKELYSPEGPLKPASKIHIQGGDVLRIWDEMEDRATFEDKVSSSIVRVHNNDFAIIQLGCSYEGQWYQRARVTLVRVDTRKKHAFVERSQFYSLNVGHPPETIYRLGLKMDLLHCFMQHVGEFRPPPFDRFRHKDGGFLPNLLLEQGDPQHSSVDGEKEWHRYIALN